MADPSLARGPPSTHFRYSTTDESPIMLLPAPSFGIPSSRPYTAATMATYVDLDAEVPVPPSDLDTMHPDDSQVFNGGLSAQQPETELGHEVVPQMPQVPLTFLLVSGRRRSMNFEPETTIGRVKELVWNAWPSEWQDERPPAPSYLRILYLGKILQDDDTLAKLSFPSYTPPPPSHQSQSHPTTPLPSTIVHISIRPMMPASDDDALKKKRRRTILGRNGSGQGADDGADEGEGGGCCSGCVIC